MTTARDEIVLMQDDWSGSNTARRRFKVICPLGRDPYKWRAISLQQHYAVVDGVSCYEMYDDFEFKSKLGAYHSLNQMSALSWGTVEWTRTSSNGWRVWISNLDPAKSMILTPPTGTTRVYIIAEPSASEDGTGTVTCNGGNVEKASISFDNVTGDFGAEPSLRGALLIASFTSANGTTDTVTIAPVGDGQMRVVGFITVNDTDSAVIEDGTAVIDPATIKGLQKDPRASEQTVTHTHVLNFGDTAEENDFWWGQGHWSALQTLINEAETLTYGASGTAWAPAADQFVYQKTDRFVRRLVGDISCNDGATQYTVGTHEDIYMFSCSAPLFKTRQVWNATAEAQGLVIRGGGGYNGEGHCGMWGIDQRFTQARAIPAQANSVAVDIYDGQYYCVYNGKCWAAYSAGTVIQVIADGYVLANGVIKSAVDGVIQSRSDAGGFPKIYIYWINADVTLTDGDISESRMVRIAIDRLVNDSWILS